MRKFGSNYPGVILDSPREQIYSTEEIKIVNPQPKPEGVGEEKRRVTDKTANPPLPFVGRKEELAVLDKFLDQALLGKGSLVLINGESGIGKTRFARVVRKHAIERQFLTLDAKCWSGAGSLLYAPWVEFIRQLSKKTSAELFLKTCGPDFGKIVRLVPELSRNLNESGDGPSQGFQGAKSPDLLLHEEAEFRFAISHSFFAVSENRPLLLVMDDLQWCDLASLNVLESLIMNGMKNRRILILALYRDQEVEDGTNPHVLQFLSRLGQQLHPGLVHLGRFSEDGVADLVERVFAEPQKESPDEQTKKNRDKFRLILYERTGGNPLFIEETIKSLLESGLIFRDKKRGWVYPGPELFKVPSTVSSVIAERLRRLSQQSLDILRVASTIGEEFTLKILLEVLAGKKENQEQELLGILEGALRTGLLVKREDTNPEAYRFSDECVHDVLYGQQDHTARAVYHLRAAQVLEREYALERANLEHSFGLAFHFLRGGDYEKSVRYLILAAKRASELYAHADSFSHYESASKLIEERIKRGHFSPREGDLLLADTLRSMGDEAQYLPEYLKTFDCWRRSEELYERNGEFVKAANICVKLGLAYHLVIYELNESKASLQKAVELVKRVGGAPPEDLARVYAYSLAYDIWEGEAEKVKQQAALASRYAKESGAYDVIAMLKSYVIATDSVDEVEKSMKSCNEGIQISKEHNLVWEGSYNYFHRACNYSYTYGASKKALDLFEEGLSYTESKGNFMVNLFHKVELVTSVLIPLGEWKKAREIAENSIASVQNFSPNSLFQLIARSAMGQVHLYSGELEQAEKHLLRVRDVTKGFGVLQLDVPLYISLYRLYREKGDDEEAGRSLMYGYRLSKKRGLSVINAYPHVQLLSLIIEFLVSSKEGSIIDGMGLLRRANYFLADLEHSSDLIDKEWTLGYLYRSRALMQEKDGQEIEKAESSFKKAIEIFSSIGWPYEVARTRFMLGMMHFGRGNIRTAVENMNSALPIFTSLGAKCDIERVSNFQRALRDKGIPLLDEHPNFIRPESKAVFECLKREFYHDFLFDKNEEEKSGWRSLGEIAHSLNLSKHVMYGREAGKAGPVLKELLKSGRVEMRSFAGERGRGGKIAKIRITTMPGKARLGNAERIQDGL